MCQEQMTFVQFDNRGDDDGLLKFEVTQFLNAIFKEHRLCTRRFREGLDRKSYVGHGTMPFKPWPWNVEVIPGVGVVGLVRERERELELELELENFIFQGL